MDVWVAPLDVAPAVQARLVATLSPQERAQADRYRFPDDARRYRVAKGWLRQVLGADVTFAEGPGKPEVVGGPKFNVSHAGELTVIAVADHEVGVDVEHRSSGRAGLDASRVACTPAEASVISRLPADERADAFLRLWTAKEAYLKGIGVGLAVAPDSIELHTDAVGWVIGDPAWWVRALPLGPDHIGAVAADRPEVTIRLRPVPHPVLAAPI